MMMADRSIDDATQAGPSASFVIRDGMAGPSPDGSSPVASDVIEDLRHAVQCCPRDAVCLERLGDALYSAGNYDEAAGCYRRALASHPDSPTACANLGATLLSQRRTLEASKFLLRAIALAPDCAQAHNNLGVALETQGDTQAAIESFEDAITLDGDYRDAYVNLGDAWRQLGRWAEATEAFTEALRIDFSDTDTHNALGAVYLDQQQLDRARQCFEQAIAIDGTCAEAHNNLGLVYRDQGQFATAIESFTRAITHAPESAEAHHNLGLVWHERGNPAQALRYYQRAISIRGDFVAALDDLARSYRELDCYDQALPYLQRVVDLRPNVAEAHSNLGAVLHHLRRYDDAEEAYARAIELAPRLAAVRINAANLARDRGDTDAAIFRARTALEVDPTSAKAHLALGNAYRDRLEVETALKHFDRAIELDTDCADAHLCRAMTRLSRGDWNEAWPAFEWRWRTERYRRATPPAPRWIGQSLRGRSILVRDEGGLGDTLHFSRYLPVLKAVGAHVIFACDARLHSLLRLATLGIDTLTANNNQPPPHDYQTSLLSLPGILRTNPQFVPCRRAYLSADASLVDSWRARLPDVGRLRVGICWQGNPAYHHDHSRSIPVDLVDSLTRNTDFCFINLQRAGRVPTGVVDLGQLDGDAGAFMDSAAIIRNLDLVVTVDSAIGHLAGALGCPVWLALSYAADWRWMLNRADTPWYPRTRLFRQSAPGDWDELLSAMQSELHLLADQRG